MAGILPYLEETTAIAVGRFGVERGGSGFDDTRFRVGPNPLPGRESGE